jgi:hypothetical protein
MFSLPNGIYILFGSVLGALISGGLLIINNSRNNEFQLERENQQRIGQEKIEKQKWYRERIYESYRTCIHILTKIIQLKIEMSNHGNTPDKVTDITKLSIDFTAEFYIILINHPNRNGEEFKEKKSQIFDNLEDKPSVARYGMIEIMESDPRIKDVNTEYLNSEKSSTQSS